MTRIEEAIIFATAAHTGQMRKDGLTPYIVHPLGVAESVRRQGGSEDQYIAALLHDTVEDTDVVLETIKTMFGPVVAALVDELTNVYTTEAFPDKNRAERKRLENERLAEISEAAKVVKICDIAYNVNDLDGIKGGFKQRMLREKIDMLMAICEDASQAIQLQAGPVMDYMVMKLELLENQ